MAGSSTAKSALRAINRGNPFGFTPEALEANEEYRALAAELDEEAREQWYNPEWHRQVAQDISDSLDYGFTFDNFFSTYFLTQQVGEFDRVVLRERRGMKAYWTARGGEIDETYLTTEKWELPRDTIGFHVREHDDNLRAGFAEQLSSIITLGQARLECEVNRRIFSLLTAAIPNSSDYYVTGAGMDAADLNGMIAEVKDSIKPNGQGPVPVTVIGRSSMTDQISDFPGFSEEAKEEIRTRGRLGIYRGANIVTINNWTDEDGESYLPANELWVFGGTVGKFAAYGGLLTKTWQENNIDYTHYRARKDAGGLVHHPEQARRFVDSSVTP